MFERFTDRARRVVVLAQEEARALSHNYIGTEHILLGLIREDGGVAGHVLAELGVRLEAARQQVREIIGEGGQEPGGHIPFTPRAKKVLELSLREALVLGHDYIGTEHILLGLIREGEGVACVALERLGTPPARLREPVLRSVGTGVQEPGGPVVGRATRAATGVPPLAQFGVVLRRLDEILGRLAAIERHLGIQPPAPAAAGEPSGGSAPAAEDEPPAAGGEPPAAAGGPPAAGQA